MRINKVINDKYLFLESEIESVPEFFSKKGQEIKNSRNETKVFDLQGIKTVVKRFKKITTANRIIFANTSRFSKAHRAYNSSKRLLDIGLLSPEPIAYIDIFDNLLLTDCYYICRYVESESLESLFKRDNNDHIDILKSLGKCIFTLHENNIFLGDLNLGNILYEKHDDTCNLYIIDNNRFFTKKANHKNRIKNFNRLEVNDEQLKEICDEYARLYGYNSIQLQNEIKVYRKRHIDFVDKKHSLKKIFSIQKHK